MLTQATSDNSVWQDTAAVTGDFADWLVSERLMTPDIERSFDAPVRIDVLREGPTVLPEDVVELVCDSTQRAWASRGWVREIAMHSGETLLVHALCFAPEQTLRAHPWLAELGASPLGGQLVQRDDVARVAQHYCRSGMLSAGRAGDGRWRRTTDRSCRAGGRRCVVAPLPVPHR